MTNVLQHHDGGPIAFLGGAYGNVPALTACLDDAQQQGAALRVFLGDATGCCGHSDTTIDLLREYCQVHIAGNHEVQAAAGELTCGCGYGSGEDERLSCAAHAYAMHSLRADQRKLIASWPLTGLITTPHGRILLCHGSPDRNNEFLYESQIDEPRLEAWLDAHDAVGLACTHTGLPWVRYLAGGRFALNAGVVGKPDHDGDPAVHYALLRWIGGQPRIGIQRVAYRHALWADQLAVEGVDPVFLEPLRTGWWTVGEASLPPAESARRQSPSSAFYARIARGEDSLGVPCCSGAAAQPPPDIATLGYDPQAVAALPAGVDLGLGCGSPVPLARLRPGEVVVDLGSGGGLDCLLAAQAVGRSGRVIGVDATPEMIAKAQAQAQRVGLPQVEFRLGVIEHLPVADASVDVVLSNCVINLSPNKPQVLAEAHRVLRPGGRLVIADTVALAEIPQEMRDDQRLHDCCVAGATLIGEYRQMLAEAGFVDIAIDLHERSADIVSSWVPGSRAETVVGAASITACRALDG
mgnify:CR=1 FL=1